MGSNELQRRLKPGAGALYLAEVVALSSIGPRCVNLFALLTLVGTKVALFTRVVLSVVLVPVVLSSLHFPVLDFSVGLLGKLS